MTAPASPKGSATRSGYDARLTQAAADCIEQGQAPPREIYRVQNRRRIDWGRLPLWARPSDPELFDGCCHEG